MNVFVLSTGRCGSMTFAKACEHINNYTSGHETRATVVKRRFDYPRDHIEVDNRLSWMLGPLGRRFPHAQYVHLTRSPKEVASSYARRFHIRAGIMPAFASGILRRRPPTTDSERMAAARLYTAIVNENIEEFLNNKRSIQISIHDPIPGFTELWNAIGAVGNFDKAVEEFGVKHNAKRR